MTRDPHVALFRRLALQLPDAVESSHMGHSDFRLNSRIFATLSGQEKGRGVLKLTLEQQQAFLADQPNIFSPVQGGWGRMGMTYIHLKEADESILAGALKTAYQNVHAKQSQKRSPKESQKKSETRSQKKSQKKSVKSSQPAKATRSALQ